MSDDHGLEIAVDTRDGVSVVSPSGDVDMSASPVLRTILLGLVRTSRPLVVVDLTGVPYMDSSGVATLVEAMKYVRQNGGAMALCHMNERVKGIFEIARLDQYFSICDSICDAIEAL